MYGIVVWFTDVGPGIAVWFKFHHTASVIALIRAHLRKQANYGVFMLESTAFLKKVDVASGAENGHLTSGKLVTYESSTCTYKVTN